MADATSPLVTTEHFDDQLVLRRARRVYRVSLLQGGVIIGAVVALVKLL